MFKVWAGRHLLENTLILFHSLHFGIQSVSTWGWGVSSPSTSGLLSLAHAACVPSVNVYPVIQYPLQVHLG